MVATKKIKDMLGMGAPAPTQSEPEVSVLLKTYQDILEQAEAARRAERQPHVTAELEHLLNLLRIMPERSHPIEYDENAKYFKSQGFIVLEAYGGMRRMVSIPRKQESK